MCRLHHNLLDNEKQHLYESLHIAHIYADIFLLIAYYFSRYGAIGEFLLVSMYHIGWVLR